MKKLLLLLASIVVICSCDKENSKIDPSLVNVEIELSCIDEEPEYYGSDIIHTILCKGSIGGFTGDATISISSHEYIGSRNQGSRSISVAGDNTSFSFTFEVVSYEEYTNTPVSFDISVKTNSQTLFVSSAVIYL